MPRTLMSVKKVAGTLHVSAREVVRMAEQRILPSKKIKGIWQFRSGEIWNWIEENLHILPKQRERDRHPEATGVLLVTTALPERAIAVDLVAKTKSSVLRQLARMAAEVDPYIDMSELVEALFRREAQGSTALQDGVAIPHPSKPLYSQGAILAAVRTSQGIVFGERGGGLSDLFFLVCCPDQTEHLLFLGRLCRLLIDKALQEELRMAENVSQFAEGIERAEKMLCELD